MSTPAKTILALCLAGASFLAGALWNQNSGRSSPGPGVRRILYYHDPMHPAYKSDKPGIAPDCGMQLEPVYEGGSDSGRDKPVLPPGSVQVSADRQQAMGIRVEPVTAIAAGHTARVLGRVAADESRIYKINATVDGWIREIETAATTGSLVSKGQVLATYYAPEFLSAQEAYLYALSTMDRFQASGIENESQIRLTNANIRQARDSLQVLGMGEAQLDEIAKTKKNAERIRIVSPADGFILARDVTPGQRFQRGAEFFRIADLSHVWVTADLFENEARLAESARTATVRYQGQTFAARVSSTPAIFDAGTRTLRLRLEAENPRHTLRPDMFVDVELSVRAPQAGLTVPAEAIVDSGLRKTVFIDRGNGFFEPRRIETGARVGDRVLVTRGVRAGEYVVSSGTFLIDSESRFQEAAASLAAASGKDPACGMDVDPSRAKYKIEYQGKTYYFCSESCKKNFGADPAKYVAGPKAMMREDRGDRQNHRILSE